jgi:hypothetical protein
MSELKCVCISSCNEDIFIWATPGPWVEPIGRVVSRLVKRRKGLFRVMGEKVVPLGR